jgi:hypothetical protein
MSTKLQAKKCYANMRLLSPSKKLTLCWLQSQSDVKGEKHFFLFLNILDTVTEKSLPWAF